MPHVQAELEQKVQRERALAEAEGRAREARENEDVNRPTLSLRLGEERKKLLEAINATFGCGSQRLPCTQTIALLPCTRAALLLPAQHVLRVGDISFRACPHAIVRSFHLGQLGGTACKLAEKS